MNAGTAYLLLCAFAALVAFTLVKPAADMVGSSLDETASFIRQVAHE